MLIMCGAVDARAGLRARHVCPPKLTPCDRSKSTMALCLWYSAQSNEVFWLHDSEVSALAV